MPSCMKMSIKNQIDSLISPLQAPPQAVVLDKDASSQPCLLGDQRQSLPGTPAAAEADSMADEDAGFDWVSQIQIRVGRRADGV